MLTCFLLQVASEFTITFYYRSTFTNDNCYYIFFIYVNWYNKLFKNKMYINHLVY